MTLYFFAQDSFSATLAKEISHQGVQSVPKQVQREVWGEKVLNELLYQLKPRHVPLPSCLLSVWHNIKGADKGALSSLVAAVRGDTTTKHGCSARSWYLHSRQRNGTAADASAILCKTKAPVKVDVRLWTLHFWRGWGRNSHSLLPALQRRGWNLQQRDGKGRWG